MWSKSKKLASSGVFLGKWIPPQMNWVKIGVLIPSPGDVYEYYSLKTTAQVIYSDSPLLLKMQGYSEQ